MKKTLLIAGLASLVMIACKKDWTCSCKDYSTVNGGSATSTDYKVTIKDASRKTANRNCLHTKQTYTTVVFTGTGTAVGTVDEDINCSLD
jgi:hypothetical protein